MNTIRSFVSSSLARKYFMALSGLGLVGFVVVHLMGNLLLYLPNGSPFNQYAESLEKLGKLVYAAELGLLAIFVLHILVAIRIQFANKAARPVGYEVVRSKGGPTKNTVGSRNMIVTGLILLGFTVFHVWQFKYGPAEAQGYVVEVRGEKMRDLYRLVSETFHKPGYVALYVIVMIFLGMHLRHGFWSAFQSLGALKPRYSKLIYGFGFLLALVIAGGFLMIPIYLFLDVPGALK